MALSSHSTALVSLLVIVMGCITLQRADAHRMDSRYDWNMLTQWPHLNHPWISTPRWRHHHLSLWHDYWNSPLSVMPSHVDGWGSVLRAPQGLYHQNCNCQSKATEEKRHITGNSLRNQALPYQTWDGNYIKGNHLEDVTSDDVDPQNRWHDMQQHDTRKFGARPDNERERCTKNVHKSVENNHQGQPESYSKELNYGSKEHPTQQDTHDKHSSTMQTGRHLEDQIHGSELRQSHSQQSKHNNQHKHRTSRQEDKVKDSYSVVSLFIQAYPGYHPTEIHANIVGSKLILTGKSICKCHENCIIREFERIVDIPKNINYNSVQVKLDINGALEVIGHEYKFQPVDQSDRRISIVSTGFSLDNSADRNERIQCQKEKHAPKSGAHTNATPRRPKQRAAPEFPNEGHYMWEDGYDNGVDKNDDVTIDDVTIEDEEDTYSDY